MSKSNYQSSFIGGVVSPELYGRVDDQLYNHAAEKLDNFIVTTTGSIKRRSGFKFIKDFSSYKNVRLIPFRFASDQTLTIILADSTMFIATAGQLLMNGSQPYSISTPFNSSQLDDLRFSQNADVITFTSTKTPPTELKRHGATDWRFAQIDTAPDIDPPSSISATATYPDSVLNGSTKFDDDNYNPDTATMDTVTATYVVTSIDDDGRESIPSSAVSTKCNYYITGATVELSWSAVPQAQYYRVYRSVSGVFGFLAQTDLASLSDQGTTPDTSMTPPKYNAPFIAKAGGKIVSIQVENGGEGYFGDDNNSGSVSGLTYISTAPVVITTWNTKANDKIYPPKKFDYKFKIVDGSDSVVGEATVEYEMFYSESKDWDSVHEDNTTSMNEITWYYLPAKSALSKSGTVGVKFPKLSGDLSKLKLKFEGYEIWTLSNTSVASEFTTGVDFEGDKLNLFANYGKLLLQNLVEVDGAMGDTILQSARSVKIPYKAVKTTAGGGGNEFDAPREIEVPLTISDSRGSGAKATAIAVGGVIKRVNLISGGSNYSNPTVTAQGSGSGAKFKCQLSKATKAEYPSCSCQFDQRRIFAGTASNPLKVFMTATGSQYLMTYHVPQKPDDMIEIVALTNDADIIKHAVAMQSLLLFTGSSELRVYTQDGSGLAPDTVAVRAQSYVGANNVQPVVVNSSIVYISSRGGHPRQLTFQNQSYNSDDLGVRCPHLFNYNDIVDLTFSKAPHQLLWCVSNTGVLLCCTYVPEQRIVSWTECKSENSNFKRVCCVSEGLEDRLYVIVERNVNGVTKKYLEHMAPLNYDADNGRFLDSYLEGSFTLPQNKISGLDHLNGCSVHALVDGSHYGPFIVQNGAVDLPKKGNDIVIGLPIKAQVRTVPIEIQSPDAINNMRGANKLYIRVGKHGAIKYKDAYIDRWSDVKETNKVKVQGDDSVVYELPIARSFNNEFKLEIMSDDVSPLDIHSLRIVQSL